jgi:hypothetical protein
MEKYPEPLNYVKNEPGFVLKLKRPYLKTITGLIRIFIIVGLYLNQLSSIYSLFKSLFI